MQVKTSPKIENFLISAAGQRFLKLAGMLGSGHAGEVANAAMIASKALTDAGLTWGEVLGSGPAPSQGGQQTRIADLEARLRTAQQQAVSAELARGAALAKAIRLQAEVDLHKRAIEGMKKAAERPQRDYSKGADWADGKPGPGTKSKPNRGGDRAYATDFQRDLNETLDDISAAIDLNEWEQGFVASLRDYKIRISEKQWDHLNRLARQAHVEVKVERP